MKRTLTLVLALLILVALYALTRPARAQYVACDEPGFPGSWTAYCLDGSNDLQGKSVAYGDGSVDYQVCGLDTALARTVVLRPIWRNLQTHEALTMPEAQPWPLRPTREEPCGRLRFAAAHPGAPWVNDVEVVTGRVLWVPWVE